MQLVCGTQHRLKAEVVGELLRPRQVWFLEFEADEVFHLDDGMRRSVGSVASHGAERAVHVIMRVAPKSRHAELAQGVPLVGTLAVDGHIAADHRTARW